MTILNTTQELIKTGTEWHFTPSFITIIGIIGAIIVISIGTFFAVMALKEGEVILLVMTLLAGIVTYSILDVTLAQDITVPITQYEVTINDTVPFKEIMDKYNIIDQRGDIYILQEKNKKDY